MTARIADFTTAEGYRIIIRIKRFWGGRILGWLWLFCWWGGGLAAEIDFLTAGPMRPPFAVLILAPLGLFAVGLPYSYLVLWYVLGKEVITIGSGTLTIKRDILGFGPERVCQLDEVRNLRAAGLFGPYHAFKGMMEHLGLSGGVIAFETASGTHRFGVHLEENEAHQVVASLQAHLDS